MRLITAGGAAKRYGISPVTAYNWAREGHFGNIVAETGGQRFYSETLVEAYMKSRGVEKGRAYDHVQRKWV